MRPGIRSIGLLGAALLFCSLPAARANFVTTTQTASAFTDPSQPSNTILNTNWDTTSTSFPGLHTPTLNQFSGPASALNHVDVSVTYTLKNLYTATVVTPQTITISAIDPANPSASPSINIANGWPLASFQPGFQIAPNDPQAAGLSRSVTVASNPSQQPIVFSSSLDPSNPNYIAPFNFQPSFHTTLTAADPDFQKFLGAGTISFPFLAQGVSTFSSTSGNGAGGVQTLAGATITVTYFANAVPEPSSIVLLGLGGVGLLLAQRSRRRAATQARA